MLTAEQRTHNLELIANAAVEAEERTGCPAAVSAAQCILESAWLAVCPGNNCFGIKDGDRFPGSQYKLTREFVDGSWVERRLAFEVYATLADCFSDHGKLVTGGYDAQVHNVYWSAWRQYLEDRDAEAFARGIAQYYATDPAYAVKVVSLMRDVGVAAAIGEARRKWAAQSQPPPLPTAAKPPGLVASLLDWLFRRRAKDAHPRA